MLEHQPSETPIATLTSTSTSTPTSTPDMALAGKHIVLGLSGGVACYKTAELTRELIMAGATVAKFPGAAFGLGTFGVAVLPALAIMVAVTSVGVRRS